MTTISILIDGLRHDYINKEDSPFLHSLLKNNIHGTVRETFAFQLRPAFFAGLYPESCDISNLYMYDPDNSPYKIIDDIEVPGDIAENETANREYRAKISEAVKRIEKSRGNSASACYARTEEIPLNMLKYFSFSEKKNTFEPNSLPGTTLFDLMQSHNMNWLWIAYPTDDQRTASILEKIKQADLTGYKFIFLHFAELDWAGHRFGPGSKEQKNIIQEIDSAVEEIFNLLSAKFTIFNGIIFGDHGMVNIRNTINVESELLKSGLNVPEDFVYFLDSTQARFWFKNEMSKQKIIDLLNKFETHGRILNTEDYTNLHIRYTHNKFGDLFFVVNDGVIIYPNFFQRTEITLGMHGYLPEVEDNWAAFIVFGTGQQKIMEEPIEMVDIFPTTLHLMDLPVPSSCEGCDILKDSRGFKFFSIIIPTYNRKDLLKETLESFSKQTYPKTKFEVIVIDDGSTDGTETFMQEWVRSLDYSLKYFKQKNKGPAAARNTGVEQAFGEIVLFTGDDCISDPHLLEEHNRNYQNFKEMNNRGILGYTGIHPDIEDTPFIDYLYVSGHQFGYLSLMDGKEISFEYYYTTNLSLPREKFIEIGGFDEEFAYAAFEDIELGYRLTRTDFKIIYNKNAVTYHKHPVDLSGFIRRSICVGEAAIVFYKKHQELKDWWLGIDALVNPSLRTNFYDSLIKYAELLGMEQGLRKKVQGQDPEIERLCGLLDDKTQKYYHNLERITLEQNARIAGLQKLNIQILAVKDQELSVKDSQIQEASQKIHSLEQELSQIKNSITWQFTMKCQVKVVDRLLKQGTRRRKTYDLGLKSLHIISDEGFKNFFGKLRRYLWQKQ